MNAMHYITIWLVRSKRGLICCISVGLLCMILIHILLELNAIDSELGKWDWKAGWALHKRNSLCGIQSLNSVRFRQSQVCMRLIKAHKQHTRYLLQEDLKSTNNLLSTSLCMCVNCEKTGCVTFIALLTEPFFRPALLNSKGLRLFSQAEKDETHTHTHTQTNTNTGRIIRRMACRVKFIINCTKTQTSWRTHSITHNKMDDYGINAWLNWWKWEKMMPHCILSVWLFKWWTNNEP